MTHYIFFSVSSGENTAVKLETGNHFREITALLRDPERAVFSLVLYPESTPIMEPWRALLDLKHAGIETQFIVANHNLHQAVRRPKRQPGGAGRWSIPRLDPYPAVPDPGLREPASGPSSSRRQLPSASSRISPGQPC
jgi:anion-transporting  ArsA/GET3 family ATPase